MKGYTYLKYGLDGDLEPKTIIRTEHISEYENFDGTKDYDYYIFENDNMFHRCDKNGKLGAKYQDRFLNYKVLNKDFEMYCVLEEPQEHKIPDKICTNRIINTKDILEFEMIQNKINAEYTYVINEILDYLEVNNEETK
jgi:hypothetical protein